MPSAEGVPRPGRMRASASQETAISTSSSTAPARPRTPSGSTKPPAPSATSTVRQSATSASTTYTATWPITLRTTFAAHSASDTVKLAIAAPAARPAGIASWPSVESMRLSSSGTKSRSEEHTSELQSRENLVCRLLLEKKNDRRHVEEHQRQYQD